MRIEFCLKAGILQELRLHHGVFRICGLGIFRFISWTLAVHIPAVGGRQMTEAETNKTRLVLFNAFHALLACWKHVILWDTEIGTYRIQENMIDQGCWLESMTNLLMLRGFFPTCLLKILTCLPLVQMLRNSLAGLKMSMEEMESFRMSMWSKPSRSTSSSMLVAKWSTSTRFRASCASLEAVNIVNNGGIASDHLKGRKKIK